MASTISYLATALDVPMPHTVPRLRAGARRLAAQEPRMAAAMRDLADWLEEAGAEESNERYGRLYGSGPPYPMRVGYQLYPIDFCGRDLFLDSLGFTLTDVGGRGGRSERPDHLPTLLRDLDQIEDEETVDWLRYSVLCPALDPLIAAQPVAANPWLPVLRELRKHLLPAPAPRDPRRIPAERRA